MLWNLFSRFGKIKKIMKKIYFTITTAFLFLSNLCSAQLSGTFTVGTASSNYPSLPAAITALQTSGVGSGGVTLSIEPGVYQQNIVVENIAGIGQSSPLIITAVPGTVTFRGSGTTASSDAVFLINALSYLTINGLNIEDASNSGSDAEFGIRFLGTTTVGCQNNTISNCAIKMGPNAARPSTSSRGIVFLSRASSPAAANNNNTINNVTIDNSSWGIQFSCSANFFGVIAHPDFNNAVTNCTFGAVLPLGHDFSSGAIAVNALGGRNMLIENNVVAGIANLNSAPALPVTTTGISLDSCSGIVRNNIIFNIEYQGTIGSVFGIRSSTFVGDQTLIANNSISNLRRSNFVASTTDPSLTITGIWIFNQSGNNGLAQVIHNTVYLSASDAVSYSSGGVNLSGGSTGQFPGDVYNNIIVNNISTSSASYRSFALVDGNTARGFLRSNNNILFANGTNGYLGAIGRELNGTEQFTNDLVQFQNFSATNQASMSFLPQFTNIAAADLSIPSSITNTSDYVVPIRSNVLLDINETVRFTPLTFAGAYESSVPLSIRTNNNLAIQIYPNPVASVLNIQNGSTGTINTVTVYNLLGAEVLRFDTTADLQSDIRIDVNRLNKGVYLLMVEGSDGNATIKFVKI